MIINIPFNELGSPGQACVGSGFYRSQETDLDCHVALSSGSKRDASAGGKIIRAVSDTVT